MNYTHDCISKLRKKMKKDDPSLHWIKFDISDIEDADDVGMKTGQRIEFSYSHTKKDGTVIEKKGKSYVTHDFCPFCGEAYVKD